MSDPKQHHDDEQDELDLDAETVRDLDVEDGEGVDGGVLGIRSADCVTNTCFTCYVCVTAVVCAKGPC